MPKMGAGAGGGKDLSKYSEIAGKGMKRRAWKLWHYKGLTTTAVKVTFFDATATTFDIDYHSTLAVGSSYTNITGAGKFNEPFLITAIAVNFLPKGTDAGTATVDDFRRVMYSGKFKLSLQNSTVLEESPIGEMGSSIVLGADLGGQTYGVPYNKKKPRQLAPDLILCPKDLTISCEITWSTTPGIAAAGLIGVVLFGYIFLAQ